MTTVRLNDTPYLFPDTWAEIPPGLRGGVLRTVWEFQRRSPESRLAVLYVLNPVPARVFKKLLPWQVHELCLLLDWVFETPIEGRPFESFTHGELVYYTPGENFRNTTFAEFLNAYTYFFQLMYDEDTDRDQIAARLMATLCRPAPADLDIFSPAWSGDHREAFNEHVVEPRSELFKDLDAGILAGIIQYFLGQLRWLYENYEVFQTTSKVEADPENEDENEDPDSNEPYDWVSTLMDLKDIKYILVEEKLYLTPQAVMDDQLNNIFDALIRLKEREQKPEPANTPIQPEYD